MKKYAAEFIGTFSLVLFGCGSAVIAGSSRVGPSGIGLLGIAIAFGFAVVKLRVIDTGSGTAVVFLHGLGASAYSWREMLGPVLAAGHRVVAFDNRGFGFSERPDAGYGNADSARLLLALLDSLGIPDAVLVGHSMGGAIAADVAIEHPQRVQGLVLIAPAGFGVAEPWTLRVARLPIAGPLLSGVRGRWTVSQLLRSTFADPSRVTAGDIDQYYASAALPRSTVALRGVFREFRFDALRGRISRIHAPTLLIWGTRDRWIPFRLGQQMSLDLPNGALVAIPEAGHNAQEEQAVDVRAALLAFLRDGLPRPPADMASSTRPGVDVSTE